MYRPDRIGPTQLWASESTPFIFTSVTTATMNSAIRYKSQLSSANEETASNSWYCATQALPAGEGVAIVSKVLGTQVFDQGEYILSYGGSFLGWTDDEAVSIRPFVGRVQADGASEGTIGTWALIANTVNIEGPERPAVAPIGSAANGSVLMGDWAPEGALLDKELVFGFWMVNGGATAATITDIHATTGVHRYLSDLHPFDPNR